MYAVISIPAAAPDPLVPTLELIKVPDLPGQVISGVLVGSIGESSGSAAINGGNGAIPPYLASSTEAGLRLGAGTGPINVGDTGVIDNSPEPFLDIGNLNFGFFGAGNNGLIVNGQVVPVGASLLDGGDLITGTVVSPVTIIEVAHTIFGGVESLTMPALPLGGDLLVLMITMNGTPPPGTRGLDVVNVVTPADVGQGVEAPYNWTCATSINGDPQQASMAATCFTAPSFQVATGLPGPVITFTGPCSGVVRVYQLTNVSLMSVNFGLSVGSETSIDNLGSSTSPTDGGAPSGAGGPSLTMAQISVLAYDSSSATLSGLPGSFTNSAAVQANNMTEQSGNIVVTRGSAPAAYAGTISHSQNWVALSVQFTGLASQGQRLGAGTSGYVLTSNGPATVPSWQPAGGSSITWPLTATTDMGFQPNSVANSTLNLHNAALAATGLNIQGNAAGSGLALSTLSSGAAENLTIDAKGSGTITLAGTSTGAVVIGHGLTISASGAGITGNSTVAGTLGVTSTSATAFTVAAAGANYGLQVDESTGSAVTGLKIKAGASGGGLALSVISSAAAESLTIDAKGSGTITLAGTSTGAITLSRATTISGTATMAAANLTSATATAFTVAAAGANYGLQVDESTGSAVTGIKIKAAAAAGGVAISVLSTGSNEALSIDAKGSGTITLAGVSSGGVTIGQALTVSTGGAAITGNSTVAGTLGITSTSATAFTVAAAGANYGLQVDESTGSAVNGLLIKAGASGASVTLSAISSATNEGIIINAKGSGNIYLGNTGSGVIELLLPTLAAAIGVTSTSATAFTVGSGGSNYGLQVDELTGSAVTGLLIKAGAAGGGLALSVINGNAAENLTIDAKGAGTIGIGSVSTGAVTIGPATSITGGLNSTRITKRVLALSANSATPAIDTDNDDVVHITAQTAAITSFTTNLTGTPVDGDTLRISITGTGAVGLTWGASFEASTVALPTTTVGTARLDVGFFWNTETSKWRCVAAA